MSPSPTFCDIPLSATYNADSESSVVSSDWVRRSGLNCSETQASGILALPSDNSTCKMKGELITKDSLPFNLVLGRDWHLFCRESDALPEARFVLTSGILEFTPSTFRSSKITIPSALHKLELVASSTFSKTFRALLRTGSPPQVYQSIVGELKARFLRGQQQTKYWAISLTFRGVIKGHQISWLFDWTRSGQFLATTRTRHMAQVAVN
ncbi:hypothetical protein R3P38DRAFT_2805860 [Favolaschia claudopus]|uniref:Uncharacterized protein n=1 Tax=Favolaschia claudopus TaxID=2862362 RepID=A0AAV9ZLL8_9AGAR